MNMEGLNRSPLITPISEFSNSMSVVHILKCFTIRVTKCPSLYCKYILTLLFRFQTCFAQFQNSNSLFPLLIYLNSLF